MVPDTAQVSSLNGGGIMSEKLEQQNTTSPIPWKEDTASSYSATGRLPTLHGVREHVEAGGLMSYGSNWPHMWARAAGLIDKILHGAKPADIPVEQPTKFDFVINLTTAKALGLAVPDKLLALADEVIE